MTERLSKSETLNDIGRIIRAEIDHARAALDLITHEPVLGVHEARKAIKKARSSARLVDPGDSDAAQSLNAAGRRAARALEEARDADSLEQIARATAMKTSDETLAKALRREADAIRVEAQAIDRAQAAAQCREGLDEMEAALGGIRRFDDPDAVLARGVAQTYERCRARLADAQRKPDGHTLHELRKAVKDWRYQVVSCKPVWPAGLKRHKAKAKALTFDLGDHHDLVRLIERLEAQGKDGPGAPALRALKAARDALGEKSLKLARDIFQPGADRVRKLLKQAV